MRLCSLLVLESLDRGCRIIRITSKNFKMNKLLIAFVVAVTAFVIFESGSAIKCYQCNSFFQKDCQDHFNNKTHNLFDCGVNVTMCRKIVQEVFYENEYHTRYIRQCAPTGEVGGDEGRECVERTGSYRVKMRYCQCNNQEGCNGANNKHVSLAMFILPILAILSVYFSRYL